MVINTQHYLTFLETHKNAIKRIARHSQGEYLPEDVQCEIWLVANELSKKYDDPIDFFNPEHQKLLIAHTYQKLVRYCETNIRYAARIDNTDGEGDQPNYNNILTNGDLENPLNQIIVESDITAKTLEPLSLGAAWNYVLDRCNNQMTSVAYFLKLSLSHSYRCFNQALFVTQWQYSLPLHLPGQASFSPQPWQRYRRYREPEQLAFTFDEELPFQ